MLGSQVFVHQAHGRSAVTDRGGDPLDRTVAGISHRENPPQRGPPGGGPPGRAPPAPPPRPRPPRPPCTPSGPPPPPPATACAPPRRSAQTARSPGPVPGGRTAGRTA